MSLRLGPPGAARLRKGPDPAAAGDVPEPSFGLITVRRFAASVTFREAVLVSLLAHAVGLIVVILAPPGGFMAAGQPAALLQAAAVSDEEDRIDMAFVQDLPRPPEPNPEARLGSDRDRRRAQPEPAPDARTPEPFSRGNTEAMIAEGPLVPPSQPAPPTQIVEESPGPDGAQDDPPDPEAEVSDETIESIEAPEGIGPFYVPPSRTKRPEEGDDGSGKGESLREALARMGASNSLAGAEGSQFRYDNPVGGLSTPTGTLSFDTKGFDWGEYARKIYWIIWSNWHSRMPPAIHTGQKGMVTVRFVIEKDGRLSTIRILQESGIPAYDSAATLALEASNPLPPLPADFPNEREGVTGRFLYNMWRDGR